MNAASIQQALIALSDPQIAAHAQRFFKTGPGEYGEGDEFRGIRVPILRQVARRFQDLPLIELETLLHSPFHEDRLTALLILVRQAGRQSADHQGIYDLYLRNTAFINNWDLVDTSAEHIVGAYLWARDRAPLITLARSPLLWERRIAMMATFYFIKRGDYAPALDVARILVNDPADLIHKAVGWMLREIGKRDLAVEEHFLQEFYLQMPRTMLRYAIEKFPEEKRKAYLYGEL